jgi:hypothetical protein
MRVTILRTTGAREIHTIPHDGWLAAIHTLIGCTTCDTVTLADRRHVMFVDDDGYAVEVIDHGAQPDPRRPGQTLAVIERRCTTPKKPVNAAATALYHARGGDPGHAIVGDVAIVRDDDDD